MVNVIYLTRQVQCVANLHKRQIALSDKCSCVQSLMMSHIVKSCPLSKLVDDCLLQLHNAVTWLIDVTMKKLDYINVNDELIL